MVYYYALGGPNLEVIPKSPYKVKKLFKNVCEPLYTERFIVCSSFILIFFFTKNSNRKCCFIHHCSPHLVASSAVFIYLAARTKSQKRCVIELKDTSETKRKQNAKSKNETNEKLTLCWISKWFTEHAIAIFILTQDHKFIFATWLQIRDGGLHHILLDDTHNAPFVGIR